MSDTQVNTIELIRAVVPIQREFDAVTDKLQLSLVQTGGKLTEHILSEINKTNASRSHWNHLISTLLGDTLPVFDLIDISELVLTVNTRVDSVAESKSFAVSEEPVVDYDDESYGVADADSYVDEEQYADNDAYVDEDESYVDGSADDDFEPVDESSPVEATYLGLASDFDAEKAANMDESTANVIPVVDDDDFGHDDVSGLDEALASSGLSDVVNDAFDKLAQEVKTGEGVMMVTDANKDVGAQFEGNSLGDDQSGEATD